MVDLMGIEPIQTCLQSKRLPQQSQGPDSTNTYTVVCTIITTPGVLSMKKIIKQCLYCEQDFKTEQRYVDRGHGKFCSLKCSANYQAEHKPKPKPNVECAYCSKKFYLNASSQKKSKSGLFFCSRTHKNAAQRIGGIKEIQPSHYGTSVTDYRGLALRELPNQCNRCGYNKFSQALQVHHIDENRDNNELSNLEILCPTCHWEHHLGLV